MKKNIPNFNDSYLKTINFILRILHIFKLFIIIAYLLSICNFILPTYLVLSLAYIFNIIKVLILE